MRIKLDDENCLPYKKHISDAGYDLRSNNESFALLPDWPVTIHTGVRVEIPRGFFGLILPRSSLGSIGLNLTNTCAIIDSDYRGEILLKVINREEVPIQIRRYDRIAQLIIVPFAIEPLSIVEELENTERGEGGFGSSGVA